ncbi:hypothetical protein MMC26_005714 [Xylographa opegraphella]|nr:hypothetical protein [Xylographa opegraphella]
MSVCTSHGGLNSLNLGQPFQHDCRKTRGVVAPRRKRPLSITTQELRHEPQPHLKRGRYRDSTTSSSANTPNRDDNDLNNSLIVAAGDTSIRSLSLANSAQVSNPVAYQNKYDFENFECTTFSSIYGSHDDPTTGFIPPATSWPFGTMRYTDPLLDAPLWRFDDHSSMEEISNVHPADFVALALQPTDWLKKLENFLQTAVTALRTAGITFITYNTTKGVIQLRGPARAAHQARLKLQGILETLLRRAGLQVVKRSSTRWSNAFADEMRSESTKRVYNGRTAGKQFHTFAVRAEDKVLIHAWNNVISPNLPNILGPRIGRSYSVNLVRLGLSELSAHPYIRIQSPRLQSSHVKKEIRKAICDLCDKSGLIHIDLRFSTGSVRLLATSRDRPPLRGQKQQEAEEEDAYSASESDDDVPEFPYHKRYWEYPGSGASIGLQCTRSVSATLGGYISVDGQSYLLAVDHFIDKSKENCSGPLADQLVLTSPSLFDVEDMSEQLEQSIQGVRAHILSLCHGLPELSRSNLPESMMVLERTEESLLELRGELVKSEDAFELGKLAHRFQRTYRSATVLNSSSSGPIKRVNHRMDWALFSVNQRQGENRHRYRYENGSMALTSDQPRGDGPLCQATCDPEPNKRVYFVGQRSGRQQGVIHPLLSTVCMDGVVTEEWSIIVQRDRPQEEWLPGDSGAWIYREDNDKLVGQLWGLHEDLLLFTPIHVVFADIKETLLATDVRLHPGFGVAQPIPVNSVASSTNTIQICEVKEKTKMPRKSRGYKLGTIPLITGGPSKAPIRPSISSILELNDSPPPLQPSTERTTCPTPKLTFSPSYASDHEFGPPTPTSSPCPASKAGLEPLLHSDLKPTPEAGPVRIRLERDGGWYGRALDQLDRLVSLVQQPVADEPAHHLAAHGESLLACYLAGKATREPGRKSLPRKAKLAPLGMARKAYTWPVATDRMGLRLLSEAIPLA